MIHRFLAWWQRHFYVKSPFDDVVPVRTTPMGTQYTTALDRYLSELAEPLAEDICCISGRRDMRNRYQLAIAKRAKRLMERNPVQSYSFAVASAAADVRERIAKGYDV